MIDTEEFLEIKNTLNQKQSERDQLLGKKDSLLEQLVKLGYSTVKAAEKALSKLETKIENQEYELEKGIKTFKEKYGDLL